MSKIPEFKFDYDAVKGMDVTDAMKGLFDQLADHYNKYIKPAPITFGAVEVAPPSFRQEYPSTPAEAELVAAPKPAVQKFDNVVQMETYEIKDGTEFKLPEGTKVLSGVSKVGIDVFDALVDYDPADQIVTGENGKYDLGRQ